MIAENNTNVIEKERAIDMVTLSFSRYEEVKGVIIFMAKTACSNCEKRLTCRDKVGMTDVNNKVIFYIPAPYIKKCRKEAKETCDK